MPIQKPGKKRSDVRSRRIHPWPVWIDDPEASRDRRFSFSMGVLATLAVHWTIFFAIPWDKIKFNRLPEQVENTSIEIELEPLEEESPPPRFVETNPNVPPPETPPDTHHFAAMDQVAADEVAEATPDNLPATDGESPNSQKIVEGEVIVEEEPYTPEGMIIAPSEAQRPLPQTENQTAAEMAPEEMVNEFTRQETTRTPPAFVEQTPTEEEGVASTEKAGENPEATENPQEVLQRFQPTDHVDVKLEEQEPMMAGASGQTTPQPRPRLNFKTPPGPVMKNQGSASRMGVVAIDAKFSEFGGYTQRMLEAISAQWHLLGNQSQYLSGEMGSFVVVQFVLDSEGHVSDLMVLHSTASRAATLLVQDAILSRAPFGKWTRDMVQTLGESQEVRITFNYR